MSVEFLEKYNGVLRGVLQWDKLDKLWSTIRQQKNDGWYIYALGHDLPENIADSDDVEHFIVRMDRLLREEHDEDYCGIVYTDDFTHPTLVKIFDPNNLGTSCGTSSIPPLPGWVMSLNKPVVLADNHVLPGNRKRWWSRLWN
ncbi:MAG: hypothetical protein U9N50_09230 [Pseudomonadota bacterium]|nr:hypothetical protein [Pseudomonadota bacterium]